MRSVSNKGIAEFLRGGGARLTALAAIGVMLLVLALIIGDGEPQEEVAPDPTEQLAATCSSLEGVGRCRVLISYGSEGEVTAVAVLCDGADSVYVRERIIELVGSLYGIGSHRITVLKLGGESVKNIPTAPEKCGIYTTLAA